MVVFIITLLKKVQCDQALKYRRTLDICPAGRVKIRFCQAQLSICHTFCPVGDFYYSEKCLVIKCVCPAVILGKTIFVRLLSQSHCVERLYIPALNIYTHLV